MVYCPSNALSGSSSRMKMSMLYGWNWRTKGHLIKLMKRMKKTMRSVSRISLKVTTGKLLLFADCTWMFDPTLYSVYLEVCWSLFLYHFLLIWNSCTWNHFSWTLSFEYVRVGIQKMVLERFECFHFRILFTLVWLLWSTLSSTFLFICDDYLMCLELFSLSLFAISLRLFQCWPVFFRHQRVWSEFKD